MAVAQLVKTYASIPNLLNWETAHEPDGNSDPLNATQQAYDLIYQMDGYHPIFSIVLNCEEYNFSPYVTGTHIILYDTYPIGINATWSPVWNTSCTPILVTVAVTTARATLDDVKSRVQTFKNRLNVLGFDRTKSVWTTPQAFWSSAYWSTTPTGSQWTALGFISFSHGAMVRPIPYHDGQRNDHREHGSKRNCGHQASRPALPRRPDRDTHDVQLRRCGRWSVAQQHRAARFEHGQCIGLCPVG